MMRSLFAGVAGLKTHQTRMDVIGNNIANVNTTAYKSQSMVFSDLMYQTTQAASGANAQTGVGGTNARQIGLGSKTSSIKTAIASQGAAQSTNDPFDIMISGDAFFVVSNGSENFFTRDGSFYIDGKGNLAMTSTGYNVMGWQVDPADPTEMNIKKDTVSPLRLMTGKNMTYPPASTTKATVDGIVDKFDTDINSKDGRVMNLEFFDNQGYKYTAKFSIHSINGDKGQFYVKLDDVLNSDGESIMYKDDGTPIDGVNFKFGTGADGIKKIVQTTNPDGSTTESEEDVTIENPNYDPTDPNNPNNPKTIKVTNAIALQYVEGEGTFSYVGGIAGQSHTNNTGSDSIKLEFGGMPIFPTEGIEIDFSATFNYNKNGVSTISSYAGKESGEGEGRKVGALSGITVQKDGKIYATYDNGQRRILGQIAVATFANPSGLEKEGDNLYSSTMNSGEFDGVGEDVTQDGGRMDSGVLEMSNVDLSQEFTEMITTQRGFQANSRIITVSDTLLEELTNLKR